MRSILLLGLQFGLLACAGAKPNPDAGLTPVTPNAANKQVGINGVILSASDVSGQPDVPLPGQLILAAPIGQAERILGSGTDRLADQKLRFLKVTLAADPGVPQTMSDSTGSYTLALEPGEYIVCVLDSETSPPSFPARTRGCGRTQVSPGETRRIDISSGFGEILLQPR